ncbi:Aldo/keto reductase [Thelephora ganbajun]|uniref:Aldo/keto reductase n=1 Tax=Thelephora ganbajun TaxID=370292 RepID=A0ACB6ZDS4_THEGA|nr:Aldo/keto reductase [Thelephora ganbajun]
MSAEAHTVHVGTLASGVTVNQVAHGLMMFTWTANPVSYEQAFETIKAGIDSLPPGTKMLLNSGEFYANDHGPANLDLLAAFFEKYPDYADKTFLSVKGGLAEGGLSPDSSPKNLRRSVDNIIKHLAGFKKLDLFESARVDPKVPIEDAVRTLAELVKEDKFDYIGLSECSAETLKRANAVHPIAAVEIEVSPWSYEEETKKVIATAKDLGVAVVAYAPLGRGFLTGRIKSRADLDKNDPRLRYERFSEENIQHNVKIVEGLTEIAGRKGISPAQLCLAWIRYLGSHVIPIPGSSHKSRTLENLASVNVTLSQDELDEIHTILKRHQVHGDRYYGANVNALTWG